MNIIHCNIHFIKKKGILIIACVLNLLFVTNCKKDTLKIDRYSEDGFINLSIKGTIQEKQVDYNNSLTWIDTPYDSKVYNEDDYKIIYCIRYSQDLNNNLRLYLWLDSANILSFGSIHGEVYIKIGDHSYLHENISVGINNNDNSQERFFYYTYNPGTKKFSGNFHYNIIQDQDNYIIEGNFNVQLNEIIPFEE